ncbi:PREDICTED: kelch domain-containing protein 7A-like, partial [Galeopterus variegatus]|uniref:Kelch domain-containing protein 7A-like n=1 Tax=Galeopterus variegatus TaxID=482537 RepID=A0ABM0Q1X9_GALVR
MLPRGAEAQDWHLDMQLTGKVVLSAAALLLVTAAYRFYKSRPAPAPPGGGDTKAKAEEEAEGSGQPAVRGASPRTLQRGPRHRRVCKGAGALGCSWENPEGHRVLATGATSRDGKPQRYVETTSQAISRGRLDPRTAALAEAPSPGPLPSPLGTGAASDDTGGGAETAASPRPVLSSSTQGFSRKESLLQIAENPELQLQLDGFGDPAPHSPDWGALPGSARISGEPHMQLVARTNFFHLPPTPASTPHIQLDLDNCYEVLTFAKSQNLEALKEAAYKVMSDNFLQVLRSPDIYGGLSGAERELILQQRLRGRKYLVVADVCPQEDSGRLCCYDDEQDAWHLLARLPPEAMSQGCAICSLFNYLFMVSGCQGPRHQPSNRVFCYNPLTRIWSEVCPLNQARPHYRLVALDGHLYAIGGECLNTVECYDPRLDRWAFAGCLPAAWARKPEQLLARWMAPADRSSDMNQSWTVSRVTGVSREEARALQAASDMGLALYQQEGASYTFSSVARVRMEESFIQKVEGMGPRLKGKVYDYYVETTSQAISR